MPQYAYNTLIKTLRKQRKLTQVQLSDGICTKDTLSRIERGERLPNWFTFERLLTRLGENPHKYYTSIASPDEKETIDIQAELSKLLYHREYERLEERIKEVELKPCLQNKFSMQLLYTNKAAYYISLYKNEHTAYDYIIKALNLTLPEFEVGKIDTYLLGSSEILALNTLAVIMDKMNGIEAATEILLKLKASLDTNVLDEEEKMKSYTLILSNIARNLRYLKRYDECLKICDLGIEYSKKYSESYLHPKFSSIKTCCLFELDRRVEGFAAYELTCCLYKGLELHEQLYTFIEYVRTNYKACIKIKAIDLLTD